MHFPCISRCAGSRTLLQQRFALTLDIASTMASLGVELQ